MKKINPDKRYRFLTESECIAKYNSPIPSTWGNTMACYLGQEVPQSLVYKLSRCTDESFIQQPNFCCGSNPRNPWYFAKDNIVLLENQEDY